MDLYERLTKNKNQMTLDEFLLLFVQAMNMMGEEMDVKEARAMVATGQLIWKGGLDFERL